jgi:hypothetical protein
MKQQQQKQLLLMCKLLHFKKCIEIDVGDKTELTAW